LHIAGSDTLIRARTLPATVRADSRLVQLEALRGLAAFIVVAWHFLWAFDPAKLGIVDGFDPSATMLGSVGLLRSTDPRPSRCSLSCRASSCRSASSAQAIPTS
jgi:uncharacterized membrane protein